MKNKYVLYGMRMFKDLKETIFLLDKPCESNIYNLFIANSLRSKEFNTGGDTYLCCLTDKEYIRKTEEGEVVYHMFLLDSADPNILLLSRKGEFSKHKNDKLSEINPYEAKDVLNFKVLQQESTLKLLANTKVIQEHTLQ